MLGEGLEPTLLAEPDPKSGASASSATRALGGWLAREGVAGERGRRIGLSSAGWVPKIGKNVEADFALVAGGSIAERMRGLAATG